MRERDKGRERGSNKARESEKERAHARVQGWGMQKYIHAYTHASSGPQGQ